MTYEADLGAKGASIDAAFAVQQSRIDGLVASIAVKDADIAGKVATIADLTARLAAATMPPTPVVGSGKPMPDGWPGYTKRVYAEDFTAAMGIGMFSGLSNMTLPSSNPYAKSILLYGENWPDTRGKQLARGEAVGWGGKYSAARTLSVHDSFLDIACQVVNGQPYAAAVVPLIPKPFTTGLVLYRLKTERSAGTFKAAPLLWSDADLWADGEIDWCEMDPLGTAPRAFNHHKGNPGQADEYVSTVDPTTWHTYGIERLVANGIWTVNIWVDGTKVHTFTTGVASVAMHFVLQIEATLLAGGKVIAGDAPHVLCDWIVAFA